ncbi:MAG: hypothetical protein RMK02_10485 [Burkholderiales bacterium]|nr:hypothetical protein [Burkholderiales bacterium]
MSFVLPDPRSFPRERVADDAPAAVLLATAEEALSAEVAVLAEKAEARLIDALASHLLAGQTEPIGQALAGAPSLGALRLVARSLARAHLQAARRRHPPEGVAAHVFAIPVVMVAASQSAFTLPGALPDVAEVVALLREHKALRGNQNFALSNALASTQSLALARLPDTLDWWRLEAQEVDPVAIEPAPMPLPAGQEQVFLRLLFGRALAAPQVDLLSEREVGSWGMPLTQTLARQLGGGGVSLLALARPPREPLAALYQGRIAQREVALQLFVSNALRRFRRELGDPAAVISAHRTESGGEVRLSLSHPLDERPAEGFRAELFPTDSAHAVAEEMRTLLRECRVGDVTALAEVFPDRDPLTRAPLFFRADALGRAQELALRLH